MSERTLIIHPYLRHKREGEKTVRVPAAALSEAIGLAHAINLTVVDAQMVALSATAPGRLLGAGVVARVKEMVKDLKIGLVFIDHALSPVQQRNLEREWHCKVIDRTGLILEIFGARARTREGRLQVELAALGFQRSRLVRSWTHLERQRGGYGFLGGPGETQIEMDRRMIDERVRRLREELESVRKNRALQRKSRAREPFPIIALVGYTNAGKSTLFNFVTGSAVHAQDLLFATLDTTMRAVVLPNGQKAIFSDTVGFISDLPTQLVAAFRATLEEVQEATVILHVRDVSSESTKAEKEDVERILKDLNIDPQNDERVIEVLNKSDLLPAEDREEMIARARRQPNSAVVSALTGEGVDDLLQKIAHHLSRDRQIFVVNVAVADGGALAWLHRRGQVIDQSSRDDHARIKVSLSCEDAARFTRLYPYRLQAKGA